MSNIELYICASACLSINPFVDTCNVSAFGLFLIVMLWTWVSFRKEDPFQGPKLDFRLTLGNELSEETLVLTKQETLLGRCAWAENSRTREPRRTALPCGLQSWVLW